MPAKMDVYYDVKAVDIVGDYTLRLTFEDETQQVIDFEPVLLGPVYEPLRDIDQFNRVKLNPDTGTIEWPTGADFNPAILHDWPNYRERLIAERRQRYSVSS
ncbi:MAG: DUF2442 domain-containing protein [Caldilineaceae bacterium]|nr:DUF2442 domain-containing protein [Caldilineaceae bacterium]